jgi:methylated-DNA-[protein]-cysteine S-methyltransferase
MVTEFQKKIYKIVKAIPKGSTTTYKAIASQLKSSPRAVGQALKRNPNPITIPCHRVIHSDGRVGGYFGNKEKNIRKKIRLLRKESVGNLLSSHKKKKYY